MQPNRQDLIYRSEVRKMIEKKIEKLKRYQANINVHFISVYEELLSELDNISGVSGWIPETKQISPDIQAIVDKKSYNLI